MPKTKKKPAGKSPTSRTLEECRARGWIVQVVEYWQPGGAIFGLKSAAVAWRKQQTPGNEIALIDSVDRVIASPPGVRKDLLGFIDLVAIGELDGEQRLVGIQATTTDNQGARVLKIHEHEDKAVPWLEAGGVLYVVGWYKYAERVDGRQWRSTWREITLDDFRPKVPF